MKKLYFYIAGLLLVVACSNHKILIKNRDIKHIESLALYDSIHQFKGNYSTFTTKFNAQVVNPKLITVKGTLRVKRDSIIWISITPALNLEAFRCIFTKDSVQFINRLDKVYYQGDYSIITSIAGVPMNYNAIQSILLNEMIYYPFDNQIDTLNTFLKFDISKKKNDFELKNYSSKEKRALTGRKSDSLLILQACNIDVNSFRPSEVEIDDEIKNLKLTVNYSNFTVENAIMFPLLVNFEVKAHKKKMQMIMQYDKIDFNSELSFPFSVNSKYSIFKR